MRNETRRKLIVAGGLTALAGWSAARAEDAPQGLQGIWRGPWYLGMSSGTAALVLAGDPLSGGTLQLVNNDNFGDQALRLEDLVFDGLR